MHLVDLGSGGGALVRAAVRQGGFGRGSGYELNPGLVAWSRFGSLLSSAETFHLADLWTADVSDADIVFVYGVPSILGALERKLTAELRVGAYVVSNNFPFAARSAAPGDEGAQLSEPRLVLLDREHVEAGLWRAELDDSSDVFLYEVVQQEVRKAKSSVGTTHQM